MIGNTKVVTFVEKLVTSESWPYLLPICKKTLVSTMAKGRNSTHR